MKRLCLALMVLVLSLALTGLAHGAKVTHQLANPEETIMLQGVINENTDINNVYEFKRVRWDGTKDPDYYRIPEGKALVITDVDVAVYATAEAETYGGEYLSVYLNIQNLSSKENNYVAKIASRLSDRYLSGSKSHSMGTGIIIRYGSKITADTVSPYFGISQLLLRGYLVNVPKGR